MYRRNHGAVDDLLLRRAFEEEHLRTLEFGITVQFINVPDSVGEDMFWEIVITFAEGNHWYFGGRLDREKIDGCVYGMLPDTSADDFAIQWTAFAEAQGWEFSGSIRRIEDGWYIGAHGEREREV